MKAKEFEDKLANNGVASTPQKWPLHFCYLKSGNCKKGEDFNTTFGDIFSHINVACLAPLVKLSHKRTI